LPTPSTMLSLGDMTIAPPEIQDQIDEI